MSTGRPLGAAGDAALQLLRLTAASADVFPPLKSVAAGALFIIEMVMRFRTNKGQWKELGSYVRKAIAGVLESLAQVDDLQEDLKARLEDLQGALDTAIETIKEQLAHSRPARILNFLKKPDMVVEIRKKIDDAIALFELNAICLTEINVHRTFNAIIAITQKLSDLTEEAWVIVNNTNDIVANVSSISRKISLSALSTTLQKLHYVRGASWDISRICLPRTRTNITDQILKWANEFNNPNTAKIFLLTAVAGAGKSAIAHTISHHFHKHEQLVSSFFFNSQIEGRNKPTSLFSTIAADLSAANKRFGIHVSAAIENEPSLPSAPLSRQFEEFLLNPSQKCILQGPLVIVVDALDEGWDMDLLTILRDQIYHLPSQFRILVTSRMRPELHALCRQSHVCWMNMEIGTAENLSDMEQFIPHKLQEVARDHNLGEGWPGENLQKMFESRAEGLFLWVVIVCNFLRNRADPTLELERLLSFSSSSKTSAETQMDTLYATILGSCNWDDEFFEAGYRQLMGTAMATKEPLTMYALQALFYNKPVASHYVLQRLSPLLAGTREEVHRNVPVRALHQSLHDFLVTRASCSDAHRKFYIDEKKHSQELAQLCIGILNRDLNETAYSAGYLSKDELDMPGVPHTDDNNVPEALWYACRFWVDHLLDSDSFLDPAIQDALQLFLRTKLVTWIEVVTSQGRFRGLIELRRWAMGHLSAEAYSHFLSHREDYARACMVLSDRLKYEDRREEALESIKESVEIYGHLSNGSPNALSPDLARSLDSLSSRLSDLGEHQEALKTGEESVKLYRQLWNAQPAVYSPGLARSLRGFSTRLSELGRREEALKNTEDSVELYRQLRVDHPSAFTSELALSLSNLSVDLAAMGRGGEAIKAIEESVELYRRLCVHHAAAFNPDLARSLSNLSVDLFETGRPNEALRAIEESVKLYRQLWADRPAAFCSDLALALYNRSDLLSKLEQQPDALKAIEESVNLYRQLWSDRPAVFGPELALSLKDYSINLHVNNYHEEALAVNQEAVEIYRQLAKDRPTIFTVKLSEVLHILSDRLKSLGHNEEALNAQKEAHSWDV